MATAKKAAPAANEIAIETERLPATLTKGAAQNTLALYAAGAAEGFAGGKRDPNQGDLYAQGYSDAENGASPGDKILPAIGEDDAAVIECLRPVYATLSKRASASERLTDLYRRAETVMRASGLL